MKRWIVIVCAVAVAGLASQASAQFPPTGGEASQVLACVYECKEGPVTRAGRTFQEITTLMITNQSRVPGIAELLFLDGNEKAIARSRLELSSLDLDELNVCHTLLRGGILPPSAGLVEILLTPELAPRPGVYAWMKNVTGKFFYENPEPFEGRVTSVGKTQCEVVPSPEVNDPDTILSQADAPPVTLVLVEKTEDEPFPPDQFVEHDQFPDSAAVFELIAPDGSSTRITLQGPTSVDVFFERLEGEAQDDDGNGRDEVQTEIVSMDLRGTSPFGPVRLVLNPAIASIGEIEELVNNNPGRLDLNPFHEGNADSFFDVFFQIEVAGVVLHNREPKRMSTIIRHKPPGPGEVYESPQTIPLFTSAGEQSGFLLSAGRHVPSPSPDLPDLVAVPDDNGFFCKADPTSGALIVTVRNQGAGPAGASRTTVAFGEGTVSTQPTPALGPGDQVNLRFPIPLGCFSPDCSFRITVDDANAVIESDEGNNVAVDLCLG